MRGGTSSARPSLAVVLVAFLLRHVHRDRPSAPCIKDSALRRVRLLRPLLTSLLLSRPVARAVVRCERTTTEISSGKACLLLADPSDLPPQLRTTIGLPRPWPGDPTTKASYPLPVRRIRDFVISFLQIPSRDGHPCLDGWFRSSRSMGDFHPLNTSHTEHTRRKRLLHNELRRCKSGGGLCPATAS